MYIRQVTERRQQEWDEMKQYVVTDQCLMMQLRRGLDDTTLTGNDLDDVCGKCANCRRHQPVVSDAYSEQLAAQAVEHLKTSRKVIDYECNILYIPIKCVVYTAPQGNNNS